jgi:ATP-dependent protease HslVU (ClpYQ) ATPase subunit
MRKRLREGTLDDKEIDVEVADPKPALEIMGPAGMEDMTEQLKGLFANIGGARKKTRKLRIGEARKLLIEGGSRQARQRRRDQDARASRMPSRTASSSSTRSTR